MVKMFHPKNSIFSICRNMSCRIISSLLLADFYFAKSPFSVYAEISSAEISLPEKNPAEIYYFLSLPKFPCRICICRKFSCQKILCRNCLTRVKGLFKQGRSVAQASRHRPGVTLAAPLFLS